MKPLPLVFLVLVGTSLPAAAQTETSPVFVTASFFSGIERLSHSRTIAPVSFEVDLSGTSRGGSFAVGTSLSPRWSVRLELTLPSALDTTFSPPALPGAPPPPFVQQIHIEYRTKTGGVLLGYHTSRWHRVSLQYLGGMAFVHERQHTVTETTLRVPLPFPPPLRSEAKSFHYRGAATAGVDADVAVTSHFSVVPQVRAQVFAGALSVRPAVGIRWRF